MAALCFARSGFAQNDAAICPIVSLFENNCLMGGWQGSARLSGAEAAQRLTGNEVYRVYDLNGLVGKCVGSVPSPAPLPCAENWRVAFSPPLEGAIAIGGDWNAMPRTPKSAPSGMFRMTVKKLARARGVVNAKIGDIEAYRIDLNGDGTEEYVVSASYFVNGVQESSRAGEYSFAFVKRGNEIQLVASDVYLNDGNYNLPVLHKIAAILDIDGDGAMELVARSRSKEGSQTTIYRVEPKRIDALFFCECGM